MSDAIKTDEKALLPKGICVASNRIMTDGKPVGWAYREAVKKDDSGWRFFSGDESEAYSNDLDNFAFHDINAVAAHDPSIAEIADLPEGSSYEKLATGEWRSMDLDPDE
tara:strand:- start:10 stop:336 length:327 start_codon:yes stop_codon:yes gene_type:complete